MKKVISLIVVVVLMMSLSISSFASGITQVEVNEEWTESWSSSTENNMFLFKCTETGFYDVVFKDANKTAALWIDVEYETEDTYDSPLFGRINFKAHNSNEYVVEQICFIEGIIYEVSLTYHTILEDDPDYNTIFNTDYICGDGEYKDANISVLFKPSEKEIGVLSAQENYFEVNDGSTTWLEFTTTDAGDYLFKNDFDINNEDCYGVIAVYEAANFNNVGLGIFESYNNIFCDLQANTKYYLAIGMVGNVSEYSKLSISRVSNPIVELLDMEIPYDIDPWEPYEYSYANYKVKYENGYEEWLDTYDIKDMGYYISNLYYNGEAPEFLMTEEEAWNYNDGVIYPAGQQEFDVIFRGNTYCFYAVLPSAYQYFSDLNPIGPDDDCLIEYEDNEWQSYYWRIKTNVSGNYSIFSYGGFATRFDESYINVIDSTNHRVEWNENDEFYLEAGEEYVVNIRYRYSIGIYEDIEWTYSLISSPGDIDGVEGVTDADAEYLLMHTFFPDDYPVNQDSDFNGDGFINDADAEYLLMYTFFPDDYPLN